MFILLHKNIHKFLQYLLKRPGFLHWMSLVPCWKSAGCVSVSLLLESLVSFIWNVWMTTALCQVQKWSVNHYNSFCLPFQNHLTVINPIFPFNPSFSFRDLKTLCIHVLKIFMSSWIITLLLLCNVSLYPRQWSLFRRPVWYYDSYPSFFWISVGI